MCVYVLLCLCVHVYAYVCMFIYVLPREAAAQCGVRVGENEIENKKKNRKKKLDELQSIGAGSLY